MTRLALPLLLIFAAAQPALAFPDAINLPDLTFPAGGTATQGCADPTQIQPGCNPAR